MTTMKGRKLHDPAEIIRAVQLLVGNGTVTELRALEATTAGDRYPRTLFGYFNNAEALAAAVATITAAKGIYIIPNVVNPALLARACNRIKPAGKGDATQDSDIISRRWFLIDADPVKPAGISATDPEHSAALQRIQDIVAYLQAAGWPTPIVADSGNGGHAMHRINLPADDGGVVQRCLQALAGRFDDGAVKVDTSVFNAARIWKLYGSTAAKGDSIPSRPHRMARILQAPDSLQVVPVELLQALAAELPEPAAAAPREDHGTGERFDVADFLRRHGLEVDGPKNWSGKQGAGQRWTFRKSPMCDHHGDGPYVLQHASGAITAGCHHTSCKDKWGWKELRQRLEPREQRPAATPQQQRPAAVAKRAAVRPAASVEPHRPFPVDALPRPLDALVDAAAKAVVCNPSFVALPMLAALAAAIGSTRRLVLKQGWTEPAILWAAVVGESGTAKTPAVKLVMRPIWDLQRKALEQHAEESRQYDIDLARYERDLWKWRKAKDDSDPPEKPQQPAAVRYIVSDTTVEALAPLLLSNPRGLLLARDELAGWLGSFDKYSSGNADAAHWLSMHSGGSLTVDRKTGTTRTVYIPHAYVSIVGGIQPGILHRALGTEHRESGLAARLLLTCPPRQPKRWTDADINPTAEADLARLLARLYALQPSAGDDGQIGPVFVGMTGEAKRVFVEFDNAHGQEQVDLTGELAAAWSKLEAYAARLALIVHYARWAADDASLQYPDRIDADTMQRAVTLTQWFKHETRRVYGVLAETDEQRELRHLAEWVRGKGGTVSARDLQRGPRQYRQNEAAEAALQELAKAGYGTWQDSPTTTGGGRPTRVFCLGDSGDGDETPSKTYENRGCVTVASVTSPETQVDEWGEV